ncbi:unnamed protein product [Brassica rapa]|uniref:Uncharacterized protein n=2 Tax=Brassica TaxID=3705 RepID=A0A8D9M2G2_BRACM|nr:unnamed protein product [Brassica napus]CAG7896107.1 unnamed protein product [Brassica rapa]
MKIQTSLMCIFIISLFTLHQCMYRFFQLYYLWGWCCTALKGDPCWGDKASCDSTCPRPLSSSP